MSQITRRHFLQFAGSTLATLGLSQLDIIQQGDRYSQVLAQGTKRKLALLVGINEYQDIPKLYGCVNDVQLQQELLIHRFGFNPQDIVTLTDRQATRKGILTAFEDHLIKQAKPGDVVVFHFSGHGSRVRDRDRDAADGLNSTIVPIDATLPPGYPQQAGPVQHIMGHTLFLLMSALNTENVTVVLDSCHSGGGKRGNFRVRAVEGGEKFLPSPEELEYQSQWLKKLGMSPQQFIELRRKNVAKGVVIASAKRDQYAADTSFDDFYAGAFTYIFTQYLWQQPGDESINSAIANVSRSTTIFARQTGNFQEPELEANIKQQPNAPIYFTPTPTVAAEGVVTKVTGDDVKLWLGGLDSESLEAFSKNAVFTILDDKGGERGLVKLESRQGLNGQGKLIKTPQQVQPGTLLQERIRSIPNDLTLKIGLDESLGNNTQAAQQALQKIPRIEPKPLGKQEVQYIFGKMTEAIIQELRKRKLPNLPTVGSFGLFLPGLTYIIPSSFGANTETVTDAVKRLQPKLKSLLATRIVKQLLGNINSSRINVTASMTIAGSQGILGQTFPIRGVQKVDPGTNQPGASNPVPFAKSGLQKLPIGTQIAFQIQNNESQPLYISILVIDSQGEMAIIFPNNWSSAEDAALVEGKQKLIIPQSSDSFKLVIGEPLGISEALIIASTTPLRTALKALKEIARVRGVQNRSVPIDVTNELLDVTNSLLNDLDAGTRGAINVEGIQLPSGVRGIDTKKLAGMAIAFEVVPAK
ncbi:MULTISPECIES: caspase family protein [Calothrix]|uniref:Caspase family protein n=2 Tax=Calothrix TaxID=1186 RepID=A0ABR8A5N3_9CYAN|nr:MULTISPECIES: caspase family protein [Calothrix]MBD2194929.1 caspase family protein [Calothrix parietina FACHB-288]MBD2223527.1 caspase family protein [Calothrix anomala FACHB-343]